jgi:phosphoribosylformimino-5-aminoimidazole carboxamide ribotide isomerase
MKPLPSLVAGSPGFSSNTGMRVIPVLDIQHGVVVRGVAGRREDYRPLESRRVASCEPLAVARALVEGFHPRELYVADLDAIAGGEPSWSLYPRLQSSGVALWIDAGAGNSATVRDLDQAGIDGIVVGLETLEGLAELETMCRQVDSARLVFSLDMKQGKLLGNPAGRHSEDPWEIACFALDLGIGRVIILDLAKVGMGEGIGTEDLCARLASAYPDREIIAGGGIRGIEDLRVLEAHGVRAALVASALHDGRLRPEDLKS